MLVGAILFIVALIGLAVCRRLRRLTQSKGKGSGSAGRGRH
jgi:hypothetical protein